MGIDSVFMLAILLAIGIALPLLLWWLDRDSSPAEDVKPEDAVARLVELRIQQGIKNREQEEKYRREMLKGPFPTKGESGGDGDGE